MNLKRLLIAAIATAVLASGCTSTSVVRSPVKIKQENGESTVVDAITVTVKGPNSVAQLKAAADKTADQFCQDAQLLPPTIMGAISLYQTIVSLLPTNSYSRTKPCN